MENECIFINLEDANSLVDRIAERAKVFNYSMSDNEKEAMAQLLSDCGVKVSDIINVSNLADNYAINAEIVSPDEASEYDDLDDVLFSWEEEDGVHYCVRW